MNMGIPAVTIGRGGPGGRAHAPDEWTDVERKGSVEAVKVAMTVILAVAGTALVLLRRRRLVHAALDACRNPPCGRHR